MTYVYLLSSIKHRDRHYTGLTTDLKKRLTRHNEGGVKHTAKYRPWQLELYFAFRCKEKAVAFERYLKSHSGRAFAKRHFLSFQSTFDCIKLRPGKPWHTYIFFPA